MRFSALLAVPILAVSAIPQEPVPGAVPGGEIPGALPAPGAEIPGAIPTAAPGLEGVQPVPGLEGAPGVQPLPGIEGAPGVQPVPGVEGAPAVSPIGMAMVPPTGVVGGVQTVVVGGVQQQPGPSGTAAPQLLFQPEQVTAQPGEIVRFMFLATNHSVMQTTFEQPCQPMAGGANSNFQPNKESINPGPTFDFQVRDTKPVWFSCAQTGHCIKGMVFSINAVQAGDKTHAAYKQLAIQGNPQLQLNGLVAGNGIQANQATPTTVTILQANGVAAPSGAVINQNGIQPQVVGGQGQAANGQTCSCQCLCGQGAFPANAGVGSFGGFTGELPVAAQMAGAPAPERRRRRLH